MILTCPNCATRYVVKDGSIGPKGRKVRCANCEHSWHQDPDVAAMADESPLSAPPMGSNAGEPDPATDESPTPAPPPIPEAEDIPAPPETPVREDEDALAQPDAATPAPFEAQEDPIDEPVEEITEPQPVAEEPEFEAAEPVAEEPAFATIEDDYEAEEPKRRWPLYILLGLLAVAVAAAALVAFGPPDIKERIGLAQAQEESPFTLMFEQQSVVPLEGTDSQRISVRGRIINETQEEQVVPIIHATVTDAAGGVVKRWTIDPPTARLGPGESASFNSASVGEIPEGSTLTLAAGNAAS